jgi:hypothetical protein
MACSSIRRSARSRCTRGSSRRPSRRFSVSVATRTANSISAMRTRASRTRRPPRPLRSRRPTTRCHWPRPCRVRWCRSTCARAMLFLPVRPCWCLEAMKMQHMLEAPARGIVREGAARRSARPCSRTMFWYCSRPPTWRARTVAAAALDLDATSARPGRSDRARHRDGPGRSPTGAVARRHASGARTARENIADLVDDGSFVEYGALAIAAQWSRRTLDDLHRNTPADGIITGLGTVNASHCDAERARCLVLCYDYTVLAGTQGAHNHKKTDRVLLLAEQWRRAGGAVRRRRRRAPGRRRLARRGLARRRPPSITSRACRGWCRGSAWSTAIASPATPPSWAAAT